MPSFVQNVFSSSAQIVSLAACNIRRGGLGKTKLIRHDHRRKLCFAAVGLQPTKNPSTLLHRVQNCACFESKLGSSRCQMLKLPQSVRTTSSACRTEKEVRRGEKYKCRTGSSVFYTPEKDSPRPPESAAHRIVTKPLESVHHKQSMPDRSLPTDAANFSAVVDGAP